MARINKTKKRSTGQPVAEELTTTMIVHEPLLFNYGSLDKDAREKVQGHTIQIRFLHGEVDRLFKMSVQKAIEIGDRLNEAKNLLPHGQLGPWIDLEFPFSRDTATKYQRLASKFGSQIHKVSEIGLPLSAFHILAGSPDSAVEDVARRVEAGQSLSVAETKEISWRHKALEEAGVIPEARIQLGDAKIDDYGDMRWISRLDAEAQLEVARKIASREARNVKTAIRMLEQARPTILVEGMPHNSALGVVPTLVGYEQIEYHPGIWRSTLQGIQSESIDLIFCEAPLEQDFLPTYETLASECSRVLKSGGIMLCMVGHQSVQSVGPLVKPYLSIGWTFAARRRPGNSPRIIGLDIASSWLPICVWYKSPWGRPDGLADDLREGEGLQSSLEACVRYYVEKFCHQTDVVMHLTIDQSKSFGLTQTLIEVAKELNLGKLIGIGITA